MTETLEGSDGGEVVERVVTVDLDAGLHARPASRLVEQSMAHDAEVEIETERGDGPVRADSMLAITSLCVGAGERVRLIATGSDAELAVESAASTLHGGGDGAR